MPIYGFRCQKCKKSFTAFQKMKDHSKHVGDPKCPACGSSKVEHTLGPVNVITAKKS